MDLAKIQVTRVDGYDLQYLTMRRSQVYHSDTDMSDDDSSYSSDTSSGSSGDYDDLPEDSNGYDSDHSDDSERTIGYDMDNYQSSTPGCSKECAILIDEETQDVPVNLPVADEDLVDLTGDIDLSENIWNLTIPSNFAANLRDIVGRKKRKASEEESFNHPLIEFEAQGKEPFNLFIRLGSFRFYNVFTDIRSCSHFPTKISQFSL